ncbi:ABC transporter ATP-binding protein [Bacillus sp. JCM 19046]|nr:ABC transporter ATP-binding protein [Bacillus sp. JCM 19046]
MNAIEVQKISKFYKEKVVDEIEFTVERGSIFGLLGPNGAGKSTTVRIMSSLAKADEGDVYVEGLSIKEKAVRNQIGYVAQKTAVNLAFTARENLMLQGRLYGLKSGALRERVNYLLNQFDLEKSANKLAAKFSGGMQRKLDLAMGLFMDRLSYF